MKSRYGMVSLGLACFILVYSYYFVILPLKNKINNLEIKNATLNTELISQNHQIKSQEQVNTEHFYNWLVSAHFQSLKIQTLSDIPQGITVEIIGKSSDLISLLHALPQSQFIALKFSKIQSETAHLQINFITLNLPIAN